MVDTMLVIVPSRGRPESIQRLVEAWWPMVLNHDRTDLLVVIDDDDPQKPLYLNQNDGRKWWSLRVQADRLRLGGILNAEMAPYGTYYDAVGFMGDDVVPRTVGWKTAIREALADLGSGIVYCNDLLQGEKLPTAVFMTSDIVRTLGWMAPPTLEHLYVDNAWKLLGEGMGRLRYLPDVILEHLHPAAGKAGFDATYRESNSTEQDARDHAAFDAWVRDGLPGDLAKLRAAGLCS